MKGGASTFFLRCAVVFAAVVQDDVDAVLAGIFSEDKAADQVRFVFRFCCCCCLLCWILYGDHDFDHRSFVCFVCLLRCQCVLQAHDLDEENESDRPGRKLAQVWFGGWLQVIFMCGFVVCFNGCCR